MKITRPLVSALRALSSVPGLEPKELERFSESIDENVPVANASYGEHPVWQYTKGSKPPDAFRALLERLDESHGLVQQGDFFSIRLGAAALVLSKPALHSIIGEAAHDKLTDAEARMASQLLQGQSLKTAAEADNVGYETKRTHFKVLSAKLGLNGQSEVIRVLTVHTFQRLVHLAQARVHIDLEDYASRYFPPSLRRLSITSRTGLDVQILDYGPISGKPLIVLHPMILPPIGQNEVAHAEQLGVRLLWPLRAGLLNRSAPFQSGKQHLDASVEGLLSALDQLVGKPTPVLALVSSGAVATRAALCRSDLISSICFAATCYSAGRDGLSFRYFGADLIELALRSEMMMTRTVAALRNYAGTDKRFRSMLDNVFQGSARDLEHISSEFSGADAGRRLRAAILTSAESIKQDFFNQTHFRWDELSGLSVPVRFLQGAEDAIHPPSDLSAITRSLDGTSLTVAEGMGHLPHREDLARTIEFAVS